MESEVTLAEVRTFSTGRGNTRYVGRDSDGNEYTTFREEIGERARQLQDTPWLIGEPGEAVPPEKLYGKLKPFQQRVAEDIDQSRQDRGQDG